MKRKVAAVVHRVKRTNVEKKPARRDAKKKNPAIVKFDCSDYLTLYEAVLVGIFYYENGEGIWEPAERHARTSRFTEKAAHLWNILDGNPEQASLDDINKVYEYLDATYPETYRMLVFSKESDTHTVYNSGNNARHNICLYYNNGHFDLIKVPQKFFRKKHYCVNCEKTYENQADHTKCEIRCQQCFRIGYGYPCKGTANLECPDCHKFFVNQDCMDAHKPYSCNTFHRCVYCNVQYRVRPERASKGHRCAKKISITPNIEKKPATVRNYSIICNS